MQQTLTEPGLDALSARAWALIAAADLVVADLDGCLAADHAPLPGAEDFVRRTAGKLVVASNNSTHSARQLADILRGRGLPVAADRLILAGELAVRMVAQRHPGARVMLLGTDAICETAQLAGLQLVKEAPEVVLLTRAVTVRFPQLEAAIAALHGGAALVVANPDLSHPGAAGVPRIETGALLALFKSVLPRLEPLVIGKPEQSLFLAALALDGVRPECAVMVGDNAATDIEGAQRIGMHAIHLAAAPQPKPRALSLAAES